jgi:hypothetical protein
VEFLTTKIANLTVNPPPATVYFSIEGGEEEKAKKE